MEIIVLSIIFVIVITFTIIAIFRIKKKQLKKKVEKIQYKYPRAFIEFTSIAKRPEKDWKQSEKNLIKQEQEIKNQYKNIENLYPNGLNKWKEQNPNATIKDIVLNVSIIKEKEQEIKNAEYLKTIDMIREKYPLAYKKFVLKNNITISDSSKSLKKIAKRSIYSWIEDERKLQRREQKKIEDEKKRQKQEQKKLELENQYIFIKNHYP